MPGFLGRPCSRAENASSPPADAPTPTTVIGASSCDSISGGEADRRRAGGTDFFGAARFLAFLAGIRELYVRRSFFCGGCFERAASSVRPYRAQALQGVAHPAKFQPI